MNMFLIKSLLIVAIILQISCSPPQPVLTDPEIITRKTPVDMEILTKGYQVPWGIEIISENEFLFTERMGGLFHYQKGEVTEIEGIPQSQTFLADRHYGGVLDVSLHPQYTSNDLVYLAYVNTAYTLSIIRFKLQDNQAEDLEYIFESNQFSVGTRIVWEDDEHFFFTFGVGGSPGPDPGPQDLNDPRGKIFRLTSSGEIPGDNPVFEGKSEPSGVWSYGHRDPQGLYLDKEEGILYSNEHGPLGGDEMNIIQKGGNYGWPLFSYGLNYDHSPVSGMTEEEAAKTTILPMKYWTPKFQVAPSSLVKLEDSNFEEWNGSFLIGALTFRHLLMYNPETDESVIVMPNVGRVRDVAQLPSGDLILLIDANSPKYGDSGRIVKISPGEAIGNKQ